jgi:hypothetical protein
MTPPRLLLVAKPWRGGLACYLQRALAGYRAASVTWLASYPHGAREALHYRLSRRAWREARVDGINGASREAAVFVNLPPLACAIAPHPGNVLWLTDAAAVTPADLAPFARVFVSDPGYAAQIAAAAGSRFAGVLPFACDPALHAPAGGEARRDVCFIGNRDSKRDAHLRALLACDVSATVVGNYFANHPLFWSNPSRFRPRVAVSGMGRIYARHRLALNVHAAVVREGTNMRTFECAAYGIAQVVEHRRGLDDLFDPQHELVSYEQPEELAQLLHALVADAARRTRLATAARARALAQHTYAHRVAQMLLGLL